MIGCLITLDISSHYAHMYVSQMRGGGSHKDLPKDANVILRLYYTNRWFLGICCAGPEVVILALYMLKFQSEAAYWTFWTWSLYAAFPFFALKQVMNAIQLHGAMAELAKLDQ